MTTGIAVRPMASLAAATRSRASRTAAEGSWLVGDVETDHRGVSEPHTGRNGIVVPVALGGVELGGGVAEEGEHAVVASGAADGVLGSAAIGAVWVGAVLDDDAGVCGARAQV